MAAIDLKELSDNLKHNGCRNKTSPTKNETSNYKSEETSGMMSWTRWFRDLRGKSKDDPAKNGKAKEERRVKLHRTNSALPSNYKPSPDFGDGEDIRGLKYEKKIKELDKRRYSFNGGCSAKLSRRTHLLDDRRLQKRQPVSVVDEVSAYQCGAAATITESSSLNQHNELPNEMVGGELTKKTRSFPDQKRASARHNPSPAKLMCSNYKNNDDVGLPPVKNYDPRNRDVMSSPSTAPPVPPVRDASSLLASRYVKSVGHEKYPSWPSCDPASCYTPSKSKSWSEDESVMMNGCGRDRMLNKPRLSQLKTVVEKCERLKALDRMESTKALDEEARSREKIYMPHAECERMFADDEDNAPCPPDRDISLAKAPHHLVGTFHLYNHSYQDSSYMSQDGDYAECYADEGRTSLTKDELEQYTKDYEETIIKGSHQKQPSYAQSEGYHSYVSSNDSAIITPLLDRLRRENDVVVSVEENIVLDRESSASSGSSSDTLKWHGSLSDVSVASGSYRGGGSSSNNSISNSQHNIVHSARVKTPQRHHSESVLYLDKPGGPLSVPVSPHQHEQHQQWQEHVQKNNQHNSQMRKLFPVNTYSVYPHQQTVGTVMNPGLMDASPTSPKLSVAERIIELERQQLNQSQSMQPHHSQSQEQSLLQQQLSTKYTYFDPDKKHKVSDQSLKVIQKKALLSYYERHHSSWRSEPQLSPAPSPPQPPRPRPRLPTPTSRRSSSASDYQDSVNKENFSSHQAERINDVTNGISPEFGFQNESRVHSQYSSSCGSLTNTEVGPVIIGSPISVDDWVPELPPKKAHLRNACVPRRVASPDLPPPSPPPVVEDEVFISDEPLPPPPPEILTSSIMKEKDFDENVSYNGVPESMRNEPPHNEYLNGVRNRGDGEKPMKNITNETKIHPQVLLRNCSSTSSKDNEYHRYSQHLYKEEVAKAEYRHQMELPEVADSLQSTKEMKFPNVPGESARMKSADFLTKRSVFANGYPERQSLRYSSGRRTQIHAQVASARSTPIVEVARATKYEPNGTRGNFDSGKLKKSVLITDVAKNGQQFSSVVLRHSEKFPTKLDPQCPRTTYQLSQSSYRREPRDREKGLPNFEGRYKRTMSPSSSSSCTSLVNGCIRATTHSAKDVENVDPKARIRSDSHSIPPGKYERVAVPSATSTTAPATTIANDGGDSSHFLTTVPASQQTHRNSEDDRPAGGQDAAPLPRESPPSLLSCEYSSNSLPKNCVLSASTNDSSAIVASEPKQRSSRTPRTQSDPSSVKDPSQSNLLSSQSSSSSLSLQKAASTDSSLSGVGIPRSQSDLSNVGSIESGYSSLSLNVPSPSVSPTRLSSSSSSSSTTIERSHSGASAAATSSCAGTQCDIATAATTDDGTVVPLGDRDQSAKYPPKSEMVLHVTANTTDAASQTDLDVAVVARAEPATGVLDSSLDESSSSDGSRHGTFSSRQKSQEEIDCDQLARELVTYLSANDSLHRILAPKSSAKKSTDYLENVFRSNMNVPYSDYSDCSSMRHSEDTRLQEGSIVKQEFSYQSESMNCGTKQKEICDTQPAVQPITFYQLKEKKEKLINRLDRKLDLLRAEQTTLMEECRVNDELGDMMWQKVTKNVSAPEAAKYKLHIQEVGHITSLLLGLSGRLAKVENSLLALTDDGGSQSEKRNLEIKRDKLLCQLEEAKVLKTNIDKRSTAVSTLLVKYFSEDEITEYEYFVHMKSKLLIDSREISERIQDGEHQLSALRDALKDEKY